MSAQPPVSASAPLLPEGRTRYAASARLGSRHFHLAPSLAAIERKPKTLRDSLRLQLSTTSAEGLPPLSSVNADQKPDVDTVFEPVPAAGDKQFKALLPIMARLPLRKGECASSDSLDASADYFHAAPRLDVPGILPYSPGREGLTYTRAQLPSITSAEEDLWTSLHYLRPLTADYAGDFSRAAPLEAPHPFSGHADAAQCPFATSQSSASKTSLELIRRVFNWSALALPPATSGRWYGVVFRSRRRLGSESTNLYTADKLSHEEAVNHGGLLMYWYGTPDPISGMNLATCIWTDRESARSASKLPRHREAVKHAALAYSSFELSRYCVVKVAGESGVRIEAWTE